MVKSYLRYELEDSFGVIVSPTGNILYDVSGTLAIVPALESIVIWNIRQGIKVHVLTPGLSSLKKSQITSLALSPEGDMIAAGYSDGVIRLWNVHSGALEITLDGHRSAVNCLTYSTDGSNLASGSKDTDLIVWDLVAQVGLYRLKGHKDAITCVRFLHTKTNKTTGVPPYLLSSSKDGLLKVWECETQHCIQTCVGHRSEIWSFDLNADQTRVVTGSSDNLLRIWSIDSEPQESSSKCPMVLNYMGALTRQVSERVDQVLIRGAYVSCQSIGKAIEFFRFRTEAQVKKKTTRRLKRVREKLGKTTQPISEPDVEPVEDTSSNTGTTVQDEIETCSVLRTVHKIRSCHFRIPNPSSLSVVVGLNNNSLEVYSLKENAKNEEKVPTTTFHLDHAMTLAGHRSDVRFSAISSDNLLILSGSSSLVKIWNAQSLQCIRTFATSLTLCGAFLPGNRHIVVATKEGLVELYDLQTGERTYQDKSHEGAIWTLDIKPDGSGLVTGGADQRVKFWEFELVEAQLSLVHTRTLTMTDDILCLKYANTHDPTKLLLAVALLDCTVKVFYDDSLKFFLSLYGHKLPVMAMDISSDDMMLVTASADKNVKLWGLDFGDCHKSIFAHDESIMAISFVGKSHCFFTASKDTTVKYWDGDVFEHILTLSGHFGQVWGLAVSPDGSFVVSVSNDRSLRKWTRTQDQVFLEEERETRLETMFESELNHNKSKEEQQESSSAGKKSVTTVQAGERVMDALDLVEAEDKIWTSYARARDVAWENLSVADQTRRKVVQAKVRAKETLSAEDRAFAQALVPEPARNMLLLQHTPSKYLLKVIKGVRHDELEEALLVLPFDYVQRLIPIFVKLLVQSRNEMELCLKCILHLLRMHHEAICAQRSLILELDALWTHLRAQLGNQKDRVGCNLAGMKYLKRQFEANKTIHYIEDRSKPAPKRKKTKTLA